MGLAEIARAKAAFEAGPLRSKLARAHADPDNAFHNWCDPWLLPDFLKLDLTDALAHLRLPVLIVQGENDQYGTTRQIEVARKGVLLPGRGCAIGGHPPCAASGIARGNFAGDCRLLPAAIPGSSRRGHCRPGG
jgi:hypothetical protein